MTGGEFPTIHMPKTVVILIGTNDLTYADCHEDQQEILDAAPGIVYRCAGPLSLHPALNLGTAQMPDIQIFLYRSSRIEIRANAAVYAALAYRSTVRADFWGRSEVVGVVKRAG